MTDLGRSLLFFIVIASFADSEPVAAAEVDALGISSNIQVRHLPFGTVLDPIVQSITSSAITGYTRCGDSATWTGHYLAAESFRYQVTRSAEALANIRNAVQGIKTLVDVTGTNLLARCFVPINSPYAAGIRSEEAHNGIYTNTSAGLLWVGNTSRDQYTGVIFGLGVAFDLVDDTGVQSAIRDLVTRLIDFLASNAWTVVMPDGTASTTFAIRPDQVLTFLQVARHMNPAKFTEAYSQRRALSTPLLLLPVSIDVLNDDSYFKFNLDYIDFYNLIRLEDGSGNSVYRQAYDLVRHHTANHQNAFFNMIDRALNGPDPKRDAETLALLGAWLERPRSAKNTDLHALVSVCGGQACTPVAVPWRPPTEFVWQRNPFQLSGGADVAIENAGIDYILPYWMARYYSVTSPFLVQSAASSTATTATGSIASFYGTNLAKTAEQARTQPLPQSLAGINVSVRDAAGAERTASLYYASPGQINFIVPSGTVPGLATFTVTGNGVTSVSAPGTVLTVAPTLFSASGSGTGVAAATATRTRAGMPGVDLPVFSCTAAGCVSTPIELSADTRVYLSLFGTGIAHRTSLVNVSATIGGTSVPILYAGPQSQYAGLDQVNLELPFSLRGAGEANVVLSADGQTANTVTINLK